MARQRALTLAEAAQRLQVTPQRISQMLHSGALEGPDVGPGRARKGVPRVWEASLQQELARRRTARPRTTHRLAAGPDADVSKSSEAHGEASRSAREAAALKAVLRMKIRLDDAREALRQERESSKRLTRLLAAATAELQAAQAQADRLDDIALGYSEALTQLVVPDPPDSVP